MRLFRFIGYFLQLQRLIGLRAASAFALVHARNKRNPPHDGELAHVPVGPYVFYFPSLPYFEGLFTEIFFKGTYRLAATRNPIRVIDCGANIGVSLLYFKIRAPQARVLCFEPNPAARAVLEKNIEANGWKKDVQVFPYALGKEKGMMRFFVEKNAPTSSGGSATNYLKEEGRELDVYDVEMTTLSQYIDSDIALLKIDIEGAEFDVLEELATQDSMRHIAAIQLEYHYIPGFFTRPLSDLLALLESHGFHTSVQSNAPTNHIADPAAIQTSMVFAQR